MWSTVDCILGSLGDEMSDFGARDDFSDELR